MLLIAFMKQNKVFKLSAGQIVQLVPPMGGCIATDRITVDGNKVGYMCRKEPINDIDSGWQFFAGDEDEEYMDNLDNCMVYQVNTIANYDPDIIEFLHAPVGSEFERDEQTGQFIQIK